MSIFSKEKPQKDEINPVVMYGYRRHFERFCRKNMIKTDKNKDGTYTYPLVQQRWCVYCERRNKIGVRK